MLKDVARLAMLAIARHSCGQHIESFKLPGYAHPNVRLAWSVKHSAVALVEELNAALSRVPEKKVLVGARLDIREMLGHEAASGYRRVGVVVCRPWSMCNDAQAQVTALGRGSGKTKPVFELQVDVFSW